MNQVDTTGAFTLAGIALGGVMTLLGRSLDIAVRRGEHRYADAADARSRRREVFAEYITEADRVIFTAQAIWVNAERRNRSKPPATDEQLRYLLDALGRREPVRPADVGLPPTNADEVARLNAVLLDFGQTVSLVYLEGSLATSAAAGAHRESLRELCAIAAVGGDWEAAFAAVDPLSREVVKAMRENQGVAD